MALLGAKVPSFFSYMCRVTRLLWLSDGKAHHVAGDLSYMPMTALYDGECFGGGYAQHGAALIQTPFIIIHYHSLSLIIITPSTVLLCPPSLCPVVAPRRVRGRRVVLSLDDVSS